MQSLWSNAHFFFRDNCRSIWWLSLEQELKGRKSITTLKKTKQKKLIKSRPNKFLAVLPDLLQFLFSPNWKPQNSLLKGQNLHVRSFIINPRIVYMFAIFVEVAWVAFTSLPTSKNYTWAYWGGKNRGALFSVTEINWSSAFLLLEQNRKLVHKEKEGKIDIQLNVNFFWKPAFSYSWLRAWYFLLINNFHSVNLRGMEVPNSVE